MSNIIEKIQRTYAELSKDTVSGDLLDHLYSEDVVFIDPMHRIESLSSLKTYFIGMYQNLTSIEFNFTDTYSDESSAVLIWEMTYSHPKLNKGEAIVVPGASHIKHTDGKITFHQDHFDSAQLLFNHIPIIKQLLASIRNRLN